MRSFSQCPGSPKTLTWSQTIPLLLRNRGVTNVSPFWHKPSQQRSRTDNHPSAHQRDSKYLHIWITNALHHYFCSTLEESGRHGYKGMFYNQHAFILYKNVLLKPNQQPLHLWICSYTLQCLLTKKKHIHLYEHSSWFTTKLFVYA